MGWVRLDDQFFEHPKIVGLGAQAQALYLRALCYSGSHLTDGELSTAATKVLCSSVGSTPKHVAKLVEAGLWDVTETGWKIHDYLHYQPTASDAKAKREAAAERQKKWRDNSGRYGSRDALRDALRNADRDALVTSTTSHPIPSPSGLKTVPSSKALQPGGDDDDHPSVEDALHAIAVSRMNGRNIDDPGRYLKATIAGLRKEFADDIDQLPDFATLTELVNWLEPPKPAKPLDPIDRQAAAQAAKRERNDGPQCQTCDGNTHVETDRGAEPCPQCRPSAQTA